jgi:hypothetical protein
MKKSLKHLSFNSLRDYLSQVFSRIPDSRDPNKTDYSIKDIMMSGFGLAYFQEPSLLQYQNRLKDEKGRNNLETILGVEATPKDTHLRTQLDEIDRENFRPIFKTFVSRLQRGKHLEQYRLSDGSYLIPIDGTEYFSSNTIHCSKCLQKAHKNGTITYSHSSLQGAIVKPGLRQIIPLMPEEIRNTDGTGKQDCEINAGKRFIKKLRQDYPHLKITIGGDGLNSKQPMIEALRNEQMNFVLVAKPDDHTVLMTELESQKRLGEVQTVRVQREDGSFHIYEWINKIDLNGNSNSTEVNFISYQMIVTQKDGTEKITYKNSWITDFEISEKNAQEIVLVGRARWKIENECFNTLKNQGYRLDHNYGHGNKNLSFVFYLFILLAFFFHQIAELTDGLYQAARIKRGSKQELWNAVRAAIEWFIFESWEMLFNFVLDPKSFGPTLATVASPPG